MIIKFLGSVVQNSSSNSGTLRREGFTKIKKEIILVKSKISLVTLKTDKRNRGIRLWNECVSLGKVTLYRDTIRYN